MSNIVLSSAVRANIVSLRQTADLIAGAQQRLATGKRVNSALDNPNSFFAATAFNTRAASLNTVLDGVSSAFKTIDGANASLTALTSLVTNAQSAASSALASAGTTARRTGTVGSLAATSSFAVVAARTITVNDGTTTATIVSAGTTSVQQILDGVNNTTNLNVKASLTSDGRILFEATGTNAIVVGGTTTLAEKAQFGITAGTTAAGTINASRSALASQFDAIRTQIDQLVGEAGLNGVNLLNGGSMTVNFGETAASSITITGAVLDSASLGIAASANAFQTNKGIGDALNTLTNALSVLKAQSAVLTSNVSIIQTREDFTKSMIDVLKSASDGLVMADTNEEGANLLALQARQELSLTSLSLAAQADQSVLRLFR